jgi:hypothetical protein
MEEKYKYPFSKKILQRQLEVEIMQRSNWVKDRNYPKEHRDTHINSADNRISELKTAIEDMRIK